MTVKVRINTYEFFKNKFNKTFLVDRRIRRDINLSDFKDLSLEILKEIESEDNFVFLDYDYEKSTYLLYNYKELLNKIPLKNLKDLSQYFGYENINDFLLNYH